jgi:hypothetical protein
MQLRLALQHAHEHVLRHVGRHRAVDSHAGGRAVDGIVMVAHERFELVAWQAWHRVSWFLVDPSHGERTGRAAFSCEIARDCSPFSALRASARPWDRARSSGRSTEESLHTQPRGPDLQQEGDAETAASRTDQRDGSVARTAATIPANDARADDHRRHGSRSGRGSHMITLARPSR